MYGNPRNTMGRGRDYRMGRDSRTSYPRMDSRRTRMDRMNRGMDRCAIKQTQQKVNGRT